MTSNLPLTALKLIVKQYGHRALLAALVELTKDYGETENVRLVDLAYNLSIAYEDFTHNLKEFDELAIESPAFNSLLRIFVPS